MHRVISAMILMSVLIIGLSAVKLLTEMSQDTRGEARVRTKAGAPTLKDFWEGRAMFTQEEEVSFPGTAYDQACNFYYSAHDSGMGVVESPISKRIYYFANQFKKGRFDRLEPNVSQASSANSGTEFTNLRKLFDIIVNDQECFATRPAPNSTSVAHWFLNDKVYCLIQAREPSVVYRDGGFSIIFEAAARSRDGEEVQGPAIVRLTESELNSLPMKINHGVNFRQHPLMLAKYDGDPTRPGVQEISMSTPTWVLDDHRSGHYLIWAGVMPLNGAWERVDTYLGHFSNSPQGPALPACSDPMLCFFSPDNYLVTNPFFETNFHGGWDQGDAEIQTLAKHEDYYYGLMIGGTKAEPNPGLPAVGVGLVRTKTLTPPQWEKKSTYPGGGEVLTGSYNPSYWATFPRMSLIQGKWRVYFLQTRENPPGCTHPEYIARNYRRTLNWIQ